MSDNESEQVEEETDGLDAAEEEIDAEPTGESGAEPDCRP